MKAESTRTCTHPPPNTLSGVTWKMGHKPISNQPKPTAQTDLIESTQIPYIIIIHIILCGIIIRIYIIDRFATQRKWEKMADSNEKPVPIVWNFDIRPPEKVN